MKTKTMILLGFLFSVGMGTNWRALKFLLNKDSKRGITFWPIKCDISFRFNWLEMLMQSHFPQEHMIPFTLYGSQMIMVLVNH